jgi:hypothetical protein
VALVDDILAVDARLDLTPEQKRIERYRIKGTAHRNTLAAIVGTDQTIDNVVIRLTGIPQYDTERHWLMVWCTATVNGVPKPIPVPILFVNPPIMAPTGPAGSMREDVRGAALRMIREQILKA